MLLTATSAWAAEPQKPAPQTGQQTAVDKDVGKLSADGASALQDVRLTRIAIFDGRVDDAKKYVNLADSMLGKAKTDEAVFTKAEADLKPPAGKDARASTTVGAATQANRQQISRQQARGSTEKAHRLASGRWRAFNQRGFFS